MTRSDRRVAVALGCLCFVAVSALGHHTWGSIDSIQRLAVTRSLLTTGSVITPEFGPVKYGPLQPVLMLPSYALGYGAAAVIGLDDPHRAGYRVTAFLFTPALVSVLVGFWYGFARRWGHRPAAAAIGAWTLLWCTLVLPYSRLLFSDVLSATMIFAGVACLLVPPGETPRRKGFLFLGAAALNYIVFLPILMFSAAAVPIRPNASAAWRRSSPVSIFNSILMANTMANRSNAMVSAPTRKARSDMA